MATRTVLIIPTTINVLTAVNDAIITNRLRGQDGTVTLPDLQARAQMFVSEIGVLPLQQYVAADTGSFTE